MKADRPKSSAAVRQERYRDRQRLNVISLPHMEVPSTTIAQFSTMGWLPPGAVADKALAAESLVDWMNDLATQAAKRSRYGVTGRADDDVEGDA